MGYEPLVINIFLYLQRMKLLQLISPAFLLCITQFAEAQNYSGNSFSNGNVSMDSISKWDNNYQHPPEGVMSVFVTEGTVVKKGMNGVMDTYAEVQATSKMQLQNDLMPALETSVFFGINQSSLSDAAIFELKKYLSVLKSPGVKTIYVSAYTDISGSLSFNQSLSVRRAESVKKWLIQQGIAANVIIAGGKGPLEANTDESPASQRKAVLQVIIK